MKDEKKLPVTNSPVADPYDLSENPPKEETDEAKEREERRKQLRERMEAEAAKIKEAMEAMKEGKGILELETPIVAGEKQITELPYDFTVLTGMEYTDAMDSDNRGNAQQMYSITYRQGLNLFAAAAAKEVEELDMTDIITRIGVTDAVEAVQLATLFFTASTRAGRKRISKK
jgi:hypothetical protein